jgi:hypothetical protein
VITVDAIPGTMRRCPPEPREAPPPPETRRMFAGAHELRTHLMGDCSVIYSREPRGLRTVERISLDARGRYPTWDEIKFARYRLLPHDKTFALFLPPPDLYCDVGGNVMQVLEVVGEQAIDQ